MLKIDGICKSVGGKEVLKNVTFTVPEGEVYTLVGKFGEGKTTLINIITGLIGPSKGVVTIKDVDCINNRDESKYLFGYVAENFPVYPQLTLKEYLMFFGRLMGNRDEEQIKHLAVNLIGYVGLEKYIGCRISKLNYAQKKKLCIARALMHSPRLLILDEPFYGLSVDEVMEIKEILDFLHKQGRTIFMTSDNLQLSASLSTSIGIIQDGEMLYGEQVKAAYENIRASSLMKSSVQKREITARGSDDSRDEASITIQELLQYGSTVQDLLQYSSEVQDMSQYSSTVQDVSQYDSTMQRISEMDSSIGDEPIRMSYSEDAHIEENKREYDFARRRVYHDEYSEKMGRRRPSRHVIEKRGAGGSRVVTNRSNIARNKKKK